jgi:hypothetical protein
MKKFLITAPDGKTYEVEGPDTATEAEALSMAQRQLSPPVDDREIPRLSTPEELAAHEAERKNRPLLDRVGAALDRTFLSGGATDIRNMLGAVPPAAGPILGAPGAFTKAVPALRESLGFAKAAPTVRQQTLAAGRGAGYVIPPSMPDSKASVFSRILEGLVGKGGAQQSASIKNQSTTNRLAARAIGLADDVEITPELLEQVRRQSGQAYEAIKALPGRFVMDDDYINALARVETPFSAAAREFPRGGANAGAVKVVEGALEQSATPRAVMEQIQKLRAEAQHGFKAINNPEALAEAQAKWDTAQALEDVAARNLKRLNKDDLYAAFIAARERIAKTHDIERALNAGSANVSAAKIAASKSPLTGELETIAKFRSAYPKATQDVAQIGSSPLGSPFDAAAGAIVGSAAGPAAGVATAVARSAAKRAMEALLLRNQAPGAWSKLDSGTKMQILVNAVRGGQLGFNEAMQMLATEGVEE